MVAELYYWWYDDVTAQRLRTLYEIDRATATALHGNGLQPDEPTRVVRVVYELGEPVTAVEQPSNVYAVDVRKANDPTAHR